VNDLSKIGPNTMAHAQDFAAMWTGLNVCILVVPPEHMRDLRQTHRSGRPHSRNTRPFPRDKFGETPEPAFFNDHRFWESTFVMLTTPQPHIGDIAVSSARLPRRQETIGGWVG